jgi:hypothetical protein
MDVWCFVGSGGLWALTEDETGSNLPEDQGPWTFIRASRLTGDADDEREAESLIRQYGYCCFHARSDA